MAASAGTLQLERDPTFAAVLRTRQRETGTATRERPVEARIRQWQATAGNAAVARVLQREAAPDDAGRGAGGGGSGGSDTATAPTGTHSKLQYGARGDEVRDLQGRLNTQQATRVPLVIDGIFGRKTQAAVRKYQETHPPLAIDGDAGPETWAALDKAPTGTEAAEPEATAEDPYEVGKSHYAAGRYGQAYDEFTRAYEVSGDPAHLWNRAQALRFLGGRREEAIALFEQLIALGVADEIRNDAREKVAELRGPGRTTDEAANRTAVHELHQKGAALYAKEDYARAYDEFTKAHQITGDPRMLWNRAQALRLVGGRRAETITLYEQFIAADVPEDQKVAARTEIAELRGPGRGADEAANKSAVEVLYQKGRKLYEAEQYARAYDEFSKAHEISGDPALLFNRAQAMRLMRGRRSEAIALYEQFIAANVAEDAKKAARAFLEDLRGSGKPVNGGTGQPPR